MNVAAGDLAIFSHRADIVLNLPETVMDEARDEQDVTTRFF